MPPLRIGELLVAEGLLTSSAVNRALSYQKAAAPRARLGSILLTWDLVDEGNLLKALAALHHCEAVTGEMLSNAPVDVVRLLPEAYAIRLNAIPYALGRSRIRVAFVNPSDLGAIDEVSALTGHICLPGVVTELRLLQAHRRFYGRTIPTELRPLVTRVEPGRPSRPAEGAAGGTAIPVSGRLANGTAEELPTITIPDLPIPPPPAELRRGAASRQSAPTPTPVPPPTRDGPLPDPGRPAKVAPMSEKDAGDLALAAVPQDIPRAILLREREGGFVGWRGRGVDAEALAAIRIPGAELSVFGSVARSGVAHFGRVETELWPASLAKLFDGSPPCTILPIHFGRQPDLLLYADRRGAPMKAEDMARLARGAAEIAALLARLPREETR